MLFIRRLLHKLKNHSKQAVTHKVEAADDPIKREAQTPNGNRRQSEGDVDGDGSEDGEKLEHQGRAIPPACSGIDNNPNPPPFSGIGEASHAVSHAQLGSSHHQGEGNSWPSFSGVGDDLNKHGEGHGTRSHDQSSTGGGMNSSTMGGGGMSSSMGGGVMM
ncbi:uncharacterized protein IL334_004748 [Kwoniella shivajii]|uniref:Uncharacterized protein n=1 Tax=Kwoniella shivajii TaxID=564305 RepID=A0ABZ1D2Y1_9TREE|nr:hypothetical protein IL334_004748 [Kwoniella shivajii]